MRAVLWVKNLSIEKSLKAVMYGLAVESNRHEGHTCYPGQELIGKSAGVGLRTVRDATKELVRLGLINMESRRTKSGSNSYLYTLNIPPDYQPAKSAGTTKSQPAKSVNPTGKICTKTPIQPAATAYEGKTVLKNKEKQKEEIAETANGTKTITKTKNQVEDKHLKEEKKIAPDLANAIESVIDVNSIDSIPDLWVQFCKESNWLATMTHVKRAQLLTAAKKIEELGLPPGDVMRSAINNWGVFVSYLSKNSEMFDISQSPNIEQFVKGLDAAINFHREMSVSQSKTLTTPDYKTPDDIPPPEPTAEELAALAAAKEAKLQQQSKVLDELAAAHLDPEELYETASAHPVLSPVCEMTKFEAEDAGFLPTYNAIIDMLLNT